MKRPSLNSAHIAALLALASGSYLHAQALRPVPAAQASSLLAKVDRASLPATHSALQVEASQVVQTTSAQPVTLVPVRFQVQGSGASLVPGMPPPSHFACGLVVMQSGKPQRFVPTMGLPGTEREAEECTGLRAIGAAHPNEPASDLVLIYRAYVLHAPPPENLTEAVLLSWQPQGELHVNENRTFALGTTLKGAATIPAVRRTLATLR